MNNKKPERSQIFRSNRKLFRKLLSFITVFMLVINSMYSDGLFGLFSFSAFMTVKAEEETPSYEPTNLVGAFSSTSIDFSNDADGIRKFIDYCYYYSVNEGGTFCNTHKEDTLSITFPEVAGDLGFMGLGNAGVPFAGSVRFIASNGMGNVTLPRAIFTHVSTNAKITDNSGNDITLEITKNNSASSPLLADFVHHGSRAANWKITVASGNTNAFAGVIGQIETDADVVLSFNNNSTAAVSNTSSGENDIKDVGELCGIMKTGSRLTVNDTSASRPAVYSDNGNAGSLVGTMEGNASLTLGSYPVFSSVSVTSGNGYAGGLVGVTSSSATINGLSSPLAIGGTVTGTFGAGGLYGCYSNAASAFDLKDYSITATVSADNCGGVFGVLENNKGSSVTAAELTIKNTGNTGNVNVCSGSTASGGYFGGIAGKYITDNIVNSLVLDDLAITATANASFGSFGGAIGYADGAAYINADDMNITATGTARADSEGYFGGLVGKTSETRGVFLVLGDITVTATDQDGFKGGGIVGNFKNGVLRLSGVTNMSGAKSKKGGQLVGKNNNVLIYAIGDGTNGVSSVRDGNNAITTAATGWSFRRSSSASSVDDLGTWGEVVRIADIEDSANGVLTLDSANHTVTIKAAQTSMGTQTDLVKTALNIQLNQGSDYDCLKFTGGNNTRAYLLGTTLDLTNDLSFANTGITGFMRDGSDSVGEFTGTLNGNSHNVTFATGQAYGFTGSGTAVNPNTEGVGQIYAHPYNGLFAVIGNGTSGNAGTVNSLTISGSIDVHNKSSEMNIGGIAAKSNGKTILNGITANQTINYKEPSSIGTKNIGGLIGVVSNNTDNGSIDITGTNTISTTFNISGYFSSDNYLGAAIGRVTSPKFTINIAQGNSDTLTVSHRMVDNSFSAGGNANGGGLIGYITSGTYSGRKINIDHLSFNNCIIINKASTNGGGFLGYVWHDTDTTIDGLTVTDGTITNSSANVGVMCFEATGRWTVNNLTITKMSMSNGAGTSLGMLVNKAYENDKDKGLYLNVLNAGYTLTDKTGSTGITLPNSLGIYDELAAYSAPDVTKGTYSVTSGGNTTTHGAGVVSINMNGGRHDSSANPDDGYGEAKISVTGTYQNKLTSASSTALGDTTYANEHTRYYYNLDVLDNTNAGQNILLWSVKKYAAKNIEELFESSISDNTLTGAADMTGLSFYPIEGREDYTINNLTLTMDYSGAYAAEAFFGSYNVTDNYTRDPASANQHYLMHSGLFLSLPNTKTLSISGSNTLKGSFLELSGVSGVLISGTSNGSIVSSNGSTLVLDGIVAKTTANAAYDDGYLLVNNITRINSIDSADDITIKLEGISTSHNYGLGTTVAKSLLGAASGANLTIEFTKIKLDSREAGTLNGNTALDTAYGTSSSIFTDSTLLASISTDNNAKLKYYYTITEDWGNGANGTRWVTYGKEITDSAEYRENNVSLENKYDGSSYYTDLETYQSGSPYIFSTGFLPYVKESFVASQANALYYRELKVNVSAEGLTSGCGTYNDPYIITDGKQLVAVSRFISNGTTNELSKVKLPKGTSNYASISDNTTGSRWCTDKNGSGYHLEFSPNTAGTGYENGNIYWDVVNVQYYLANAYYKIDDNITLSGDSATGFVGLGKTDANMAFRGVIVGEKKQDGTPLYSITNNSKSPLINVSNGCVVKDVNIIVNAGNIALTQSTAGYNNANFGYASNCKYYGGIIGEIMGGDNIIDNSYVKYSYTDSSNVAHATTITLTDNDGSQKFGTIIPVGGYVGVIVFGGLIFKNMTAANTAIDSTKLKVYYKTNTSNNLASNTVAAKAAIYVNPIVGRVINGYAVNETTKFSVDEDGKYQDDDTTVRFSTADGANADLIHTLKNGTKHYTITDINKNETNKLSVTPPSSASNDGTINIPNSQAFFILSLITQSCAGTAQTAKGNYTTSLSYGTNTTVYGMSHIADYSDIGKANIDTSNTDYGYASADTAANTAVPYIIRWYTAPDTSGDYPARCVTSTKGYYDINLTGKTTYGTVTPSETEGEPDTVTPLDEYTYQLPDSFRGLGSVGFYDYETTVLNNKYSMKVDTFTGDNCTIDEDIYLNKFKADNYFDTLHKGVNQVLSDSANNNIPYLGNTAKGDYTVPQTNGLALFNSIILKTKVTEFTLTGSVNTEIYSNTYATSNQEQNYVETPNDNSRILWLSSGGVCGWIRDGVYGEFSYIDLDNLVVSGADFVGGIIGFSGLSSTSNYFTIKQCNANNVSVEMTSARNIESNEKARNAIGCFVGKIQEGAVHIYGTSSLADNNDLNDYSTVKIKSFKFAETSLNYYTAAGGLVGFAGNGCKIYDMKVMPSEGCDITIGNDNIRFVGGLVGAMQSQASGGTTGVAFFKNCTVERININGSFAGGFYGGKWDSNWTTYSITLDNCKMIGSPSKHNTIYANNLFTKDNNSGYAGGFIGRLYPYTNIVNNKVTHNVLIKDCKISNYDITAKSNKQSYVGGFIGYASSATNSVTCYLHDSSIENCTIGASGNYAGGIIGQIIKKSANQLLGYNIKLDNILTNSGDKMGAWIGFVDTSDNATSIQFSGIAIYGNGFTKNVGNRTNFSNASFVFADYTGACNGTSTEVTAEKQEGDANSVTESYSIDTTNKIITRTIVTVTISGDEKNTKTQTIEYRYGSAVTGDAVAVEDGVSENSTTWSISESEGKIYKVVADASADTETTTTYTIAVSGYNAANNVDMPKYPFVNINPQAKMGTDEIISGDGAALAASASSTAEYSGKTAESTMALKIYEDMILTDQNAENYSRRYTTFNALNDDAGEIYGNNKIDYYMKRTTADDGDRISTYQTEKGGELPSGVENFAVVVIANNETDETTNLINRYIQLVTNTSTDYTASSDYYSIDVKNCSYSGGKFITDSITPGIEWTPPNANTKGSFALNGANADSKRENTFTLVDVQFKDPFNTDKIAYHLYIPVYTIKEIEVSFSAAVMNGTNSVSYVAGAESTNPYSAKLATSGRDTHVDNLNTWFTTYIRYTYSHDDIVALLDSGNLNWNHDKYFYIDKTEHKATNMLPNNTYMIFVDPNGDHDKKYQVLLNSTDFAVANDRITFDLRKFKDSSNNYFSVSTFNELIAQKITATPNGSRNGKYNLYAGTPSNIGSTHYAYTKSSNGTPTYYEYVGSGGEYDLTLSSGDVYENYYISMFVPGNEEDNNLYGYYIRTPENFDAPSYASGTNNAVTKSAKVNCYYGDNSTTINRQVYIGNLFDQRTELTVLPNDLEIDNGNHTLNIYAKTIITPKDANVNTILRSVNANIYHSFNLFLDRKGENGLITNNISGLDPENDATDIQAWYRIGTAIPPGDEADMTDTGINSISSANINLEDNYINVVTVNGGQTILQNDGVTIYSRIRLDFDDYVSEFPQKVASDTGVSVRAASNLAYDSASIAFSNMSEPLEEPAAIKHIYYRQSLSTASMKYYAEPELDCYDEDGSPSENYSRLGVSGKYSMNTYMPVDTTAQYNVQNIESALQDADSLILTLSLQKKTDLPAGGPYTSASYQNVSPISNYWGAVQRNGSYEVTTNDSSTPITASGTNLHITCGSYNDLVTVPANADTFTLTIPKEVVASGETPGSSGYRVDENGYIYINIGFNAKTGAGFTEYANYKVNLSVKLSNMSSGEIAGSYADDYLIYTNAKVDHDFLKDD
ncbi:MAG: hypothetical protein IKW96_07395 [Ruminococcus sp.]|uniref:beta strand repeat-containing protein n=1 Tax=Ruminococcus sp. TaxID=41978 RepID=UPI0025E4C38E|nr:hypothetical protein [Ruminococcus sp.]MBR5683089.1 hypothetical protein [Ruminococcus sp.]